MDPAILTDSSTNENAPKRPLRPRASNPFKVDPSTSPDAPSNVSNASSESMEILPHFPYTSTGILRDVLETLPFKTSNRILDDVRLSPSYLAVRPQGSLLRSRPFEYRHFVASSLLRVPATALILNNSVPYVPSVSRVSFPSDVVSVTTVRGIVVSNENENLHHFRIQILDSKGNESVYRSVPKHAYHLVPPEMVSVDDLRCLDELTINASNLVDDAIYKSSTSPHNHLLRVSVYTAEFTVEDLASLTDMEAIKERYLRGIENNATAALSAHTIPNPVHCLNTLVKVLKGPILLPPGAAVHTIDRTKTNLDAQIDTEILFKHLGFTACEREEMLVPPDLSANRGLKEAYIRKVYELIYLARQLKTPGHKNDFNTLYSFNDNFLQVHAALSEMDKLTVLAMAPTDCSNTQSFFVGLSAYAFYKDEQIIKCFENSILSDPVNTVHYVDMFKQILSKKTYEAQKLQNYYDNRYLKGLMYGLHDYHTALRALGVQPPCSSNFLDEDTIVELYKAACRSDYKNYMYFNKQLRIIAEIQKSSFILKFLDEEIVAPLAAIQELRIEEVTEDEVVITAYEIRLDELMQATNFNTSSVEIVFLQKCLISIATARRSFLLLTYVGNTMPELLVRGTEFSYAEALTVLEVTHEAADLDVITAFEELVRKADVDDPTPFRDLCAALKTIAEYKKLKILYCFLRTGRVDASLLPPENWPTGLDNIGNTCYLNSLLQYYFCIGPLREMVFKFSEESADFSGSGGRKIGGRLVAKLELERSFQFVYRLQHLFNEMIHTRRRCVQPSKELAYLLFLPLLVEVKFKKAQKEPRNEEGPEKEEPKGMEHVEDVGKGGMDVDTGSVQVTSSDILELESALDLIELSSPDSKMLSIDSDQIESAIEIGRQQDVTECIENVTFQLETALEPDSIDTDGEQYDLMKKLFCGKTKQTITPLDSTKPSRSSTERFFSLIINVSDHPKDIYDALENYFSESIVDLDEGTVRMCLTISELPEILQFHVQRVLFDRERLIAYKSLEAIPFSEELYLDRFLDTDDEEVLTRRAEVALWKEEIRKLYDERGAILNPNSDSNLLILDALRATAKYLTTIVQENEALSIKQETIDAILIQVEMIQTKLQAIDTRILKLQAQVSSQFENYKKIGYLLFAIFIHRGEASHGHYWLYIRDMKKNIYRKYNDDTVTEVLVSEVLNFAEGNTATPYYMVYVKDDLRDYIEPLKRQIKV